jgi:anti-anti-sigma factor
MLDVFVHQKDKGGVRPDWRRDMPTTKKKTTKSTAKTSKGRKKTPDHVVKPGKDLVGSSAESFKKKLVTAVKKGGEELIIDFSGVDTVDTVGLGVTLAAHNSISNRGGKLTVINASEDMLQLFETMRLVQHFEVHPAS